MLASVIASAWSDFDRATEWRSRYRATASGWAAVTYLNLLVLYVSDLERSRGTWRILTGREPDREQHDDGPVHHSVPMDNGTIIELYPAGDGRPPTRTRLQVTVTDAAAVADAVRVAGTCGVEVRSRTWGAEVRDGDVTVEIRQPKLPGYTVVAVEAVGPTTLRVIHRDGTVGEHDLAPLIAQGGVWSQLADPALYKRVCVDRGAVAWPTELDLSLDGEVFRDHAAGRCPGGSWLDGSPT
jgi:hypothetical protein